jgi:purine-binding chemotaxis protein CheW
MVFENEELPNYCREHTVRGINGYSFDPAIKDSIVFEFHDITNENPLPELDIILARDVISFLPEKDQAKVVSGFSEKLNDRGIVIMGRNEELKGVIWQAIADDPVSAFMYSN